MDAVKCLKTVGYRNWGCLSETTTLNRWKSFVCGLCGDLLREDESKRQGIILHPVSDCPLASVAPWCVQLHRPSTKTLLVETRFRAVLVLKWSFSVATKYEWMAIDETTPMLMYPNVFSVETLDIKLVSLKHIIVFLKNTLLFLMVWEPLM